MKTNLNSLRCWLDDGYYGKKLVLELVAPRGGPMVTEQAQVPPRPPPLPLYIRAVPIFLWRIVFTLGINP